MTVNKDFKEFTLLFEQFPRLEVLYLNAYGRDARGANIPSGVNPDLCEELDALLLALQACLEYEPDGNFDYKPQNIENIDAPYVAMCQILLGQDESVVQLFVESGIFDPNGVYGEVTGNGSFSGPIQIAVNELDSKVSIPLVDGRGPDAQGLTD